MNYPQYSSMPIVCISGEQEELDYIEHLLNNIFDNPLGCNESSPCRLHHNCANQFNREVGFGAIRNISVIIQPVVTTSTGYIVEGS